MTQSSTGKLYGAALPPNMDGNFTCTLFLPFEGEKSFANLKTKEQVKKAISELYKVKVLAVNTTTIPRRKRNYGRTPGWIAGYKKAIVRLKAGDSIELIKSI